MTSTIERSPAPDLASFDPFGPVFRADPESWHEPLVAASHGFMTMAGVPSAWVASHAQSTAVLRCASDSVMPAVITKKSVQLPTDAEVSKMLEELAND